MSKLKNNSEIRAKAREALGNNLFSDNFLYALLACLVFSLINGAVNSTGVGTVVVMLLTGPLTAGLHSAFLYMIRTSEKIKIASIFDGFNDFSGNFLLGLMTDLFIFLWTLLFIIPGFIKAYSYSMVYYIKKDHPEYDWRKCINESKKMMQGNKWKLFMLDLSFIGWSFLCLFTLCIGFLWLTPYMQTSHAVFYEEVSGKSYEHDQAFETIIL